MLAAANDMDSAGNLREQCDETETIEHMSYFLFAAWISTRDWRRCCQ
jgi:hypothetical protein